MARGKIRRRDTTNNFVDSDSIINGSIEIEDLKILDVGDSTGINAETLPYDHTAASPTIWDKINALIASTDFTFEKFTSVAATMDYTLTSPNQIDTTKPLQVYYNGLLLVEGATDDYEVVTNILADDTIQLKWDPGSGYEIYVFYQLA